jgi:hypothetical protein
VEQPVGSFVGPHVNTWWGGEDMAPPEHLVQDDAVEKAAQADAEGQGRTEYRSGRRGGR